MNRSAFVQGLLAGGALDAELGLIVRDATRNLSMHGRDLRARYAPHEEPWHECMEPDCRVRWQAPRSRRGRCPNCLAEKTCSEKEEGFFLQPSRHLGSVVIQARRDGVLDPASLEAEMRVDFGDDFFDRHIKWAFECPIKEENP